MTSQQLQEQLNRLQQGLDELNTRAATQKRLLKQASIAVYHQEGAILALSQILEMTLNEEAQTRTKAEPERVGKDKAHKSLPEPVVEGENHG